MSEDIQTDGGVLMDVTNTYEVHGWFFSVTFLSLVYWYWHWRESL